MKPGDVTLHGEIVTRDGSLAAHGSIYVSFTQALKAHRFGWRIIEAKCKANGQMLFVIRRRPTYA